MIRATLPVLVALVGCSEPASVHEDTLDLAHRVDWAVAQPSTRVPVATLPAEVVATPGASARLGPPALGRLDAWAVQPGTVVAEGDTLAWLVSPDLTALEAEVASAAADVARAEVLATQLARAAERGVRSQADADLADAERAAADARRVALSRQLAATRDTTIRDGDRWAWRSPADGVVQALHCEVGTLPSDGGCLSLVRPEDTLVRVGVPERFGAVLDGGDVAGTLTVADGRSWPLALSARAPALDPHTRARLLWLTTPEPPPLGASGRATLTATAPEGAMVVPAAALTRADGAPAVLRRRDGGDTGEPVVVTVLGRAPGEVHVAGLTAGDEVATRGVFLLKSLALLDEEAGGHGH